MYGPSLISEESLLPPDPELLPLALELREGLPDSLSLPLPLPLPLPLRSDNLLPTGEKKSGATPNTSHAAAVPASTASLQGASRSVVNHLSGFRASRTRVTGSGTSQELASNNRNS
jgi:hypothetical protein